MFRNGQADKARILLEHGIDVHALQNQGWNALHLAVRYKILTTNSTSTMLTTFQCSTYSKSDTSKQVLGAKRSLQIICPLAERLLLLSEQLILEIMFLNCPSVKYLTRVHAFEQNDN